MQYTLHEKFRQVHVFQWAVKIDVMCNVFARLWADEKLSISASERLVAHTRSKPSVPGPHLFTPLLSSPEGQVTIL
jgi:hypothetical protein